jgi:hypothetical protein
MEQRLFLPPQSIIGIKVQQIASALHPDTNQVGSAHFSVKCEANFKKGKKGSRILVQAYSCTCTQFRTGIWTTIS